MFVFTKVFAVNCGRSLKPQGFNPKNPLLLKIELGKVLATDIPYSVPANSSINLVTTLSDFKEGLVIFCPP